MNLVFDFQPVQAKLYDIYEFGTATKIGFGGSRGGTKSHTADILMLVRRFKYPKTNGLFVMQVYQDMIDIHITPLFEFYPDLEKGFNKQGMILKLPNGSYIRFLSGDNLAQFRKRKGRGFADIVVDQSELFTQDEIEFLFTINRSTNPNITPKTMLCFNPGNTGHSYHKRVFYDKIYENNEKAEEFDYLQTYGWDNAYWCLKQLARDGFTIEDYHKWDSDKRFNYFIKSDYGKILDALQENQRKAELMGDMNIFEGMFFSDFRYEHHIIKNYKYQPQWSPIGGLDYGNVTCLEILQRDNEGRVVVFGECYLPNLGNPGERANAIADYLIEKELYKLDIIHDTDMEISQLSNVGFDKTPIEIFRGVFKQRMGDNAPKMRCVSKKSLDRNKPYRSVVNEAVKEYLHVKKVSGKADLYFSSEVKYLIKCMTELIYDPMDKNGMDFDQSQTPKKDHPYDGFKYGFMALYIPKDKPKDKTPQWLLDLQKEKEKKVDQDFMAV
jgi:phage terminase large subunit